MNSLPTKAEIVVVGAGVMGASIAYHIAKSGTEGVLVLEKETPGHGRSPSGMSHALMPQFYTLDAPARMTAESWEFYRNFDKMFGTSGVYHQVGMIYAYPESLAERWEKNVAYQRKFGFCPKIVDSHELREIAPQFHLDDFYAACYERDGGYADSQMVVNALVSASVEMGANMQEHTSLLGFDIQEGEVKAAITDRGRIETRTVVNAAGIWGSKLLPEAGIHLPITNTKIGICMLKRPAAFTGDHVVFVDYVNSTYMRAQGQSLTDLSIFEPYVETYFDTDQSEDPDNYVDHIHYTELARYVEKGSKYPGLRNASIKISYCGVLDNSLDRQMVLGEMPGVRGYFVALGFSGHGFKMAPMVGKAISELILKGKSSDVDVDFFRPTRFLEGRPIRFDPLFDDA